MPELRHFNALDYLIIAGYMVMVIGVGVYLARFNKRTADYFKGGGHIPWFLSGVSLFISGFSAYMFVSAAGFTYRNGGAALLLFPLAGVAYIFGYFIYGVLWRRTRIDSPMEFMSRRYSQGTTYFYTVLSIFPNVVVLGVYIYTLCIFISTALGFGTMTFNVGFAVLDGFEMSMLVTGAVMVCYTVLGGLWAVIVTDALQFVVLLIITLIALPVAYFYLGDGSLSLAFERLSAGTPQDYFGLELKSRPWLFWVANFVNKVLGYNVKWHIGQRYYSVADERDTKKMALLCAVLSIVAPLLWVGPVLVTPVLFPDIGSMWPGLAAPSEAAFVSLAMVILPHGMLGIMVAAMFAATMSSADTTFNWLGAVVTKDIYAPLRKRLQGTVPSEERQLAVGKLSVLTMGLVAIWVALNVGQYGGAFDVFLKVSSLYNAPMFVPLMLGMVYTRTPWWSGVATFGAGMASVVIVGLWANASAGLPVASLDALLLDVDVAPLGVRLTRYELNTLAGLVGSSLCFFATAWIGRHQPETERAENVRRLEEDLRTPAYATSPGLAPEGLKVYRLIGRITVLVGGLLLLLVLPTWGEQGYLLNGVAGLVALTAGILVLGGVRRYRWRAERRKTDGSSTDGPAGGPAGGPAAMGGEKDDQATRLEE